MIEYRGLWYPDGDLLTKNFKARLETEPFYRSDRFHDAMAHVKSWRGAVECGAHVGAWSRELAKRFERVLAIELSGATLNCLRRNLESFANAEVMQCALGARPGFVAVGGNKGSMDGEVVEGGDYPAVPMRALDELVQSARLECVDYIKVHVNGYEMQVLLGAERTIRQHRPVMTVVIKKALEKYGATPVQVFEFMDGLGYRVLSRLKPYWVFGPSPEHRAPSHRR